MGADIRSGLKSGGIYGAILIFLAATGFTFTVASLIDEGIYGKNIPADSITGMLIFTIVVALFAGAQAAKTPVTAGQSTPLSWTSVIVRGIVTGLISGLCMGLLTYWLGVQLADKVNVRAELFQLSPQSIEMLTFRQNPLVSLGYHTGLVTLVCTLGALGSHVLNSLNVGSQTSKGLSAVLQTVERNVTNPIWDNRILRYLILFVLLALLFYVPTQLNNFNNYVLSSVGIYVLMGLGLNIVVGMAGLLDLGYVVFFAVGAYSVALLTAAKPHNLMWDFWWTVPVAVILSAMLGVALGVPVLRLRGDYLAIVTLGFGEIIRVLIRSDALTAFTNGPNGVAAIGQPTLFGQDFNESRDFVYIALVGVVLVIFITLRLQDSRVGRAWIAIREDETVARAMGINTLYYKLLAFGIGATFAGLGGVLYASRNQFTGPEDQSLLVSINVLAVVIVGGMGSIPGVIVGAFILKGIPELLRELDNYRIITFAALLVVMMILRPQGVWPSARRRLEVHEDDAPLPDKPTPSSAQGAAK